MDLQKPQVREFLSNSYIAKLATVNKDGSPHLTFVWFELNGDDILVSVTTDRVKTKNVLLDPRVTIAIDNSANGRQWVIVRALATIETDGSLALRERLAPRFVGPEQQAAYIQQARLQLEPRVVMRITPTKVLTQGS